VRASVAAVVLVATACGPAKAPAPANVRPTFAPLIDGLGSYHLPVSACSPRAQQYFDQGLRLYYGYYFPEALASFSEAATLSPDCPMAHWGAALACGPVPNSRYHGFPDDPKGRGAEEIARAIAVAANAPAKERALIRALQLLLDTKEPDAQRRSAAYHRAMSELFAKHPNDADVATLFAMAYMTHVGWIYWSPDGRPLPGTTDAMHALEHAMKLVADHPGANHLYIHLLESSLRPELALPQAVRLASLMPINGHAAHMPSHIYIRIGRYAEATHSNHDSVGADQKFAAAWGGYPIPTGFTYPLSSLTHATHANEFVFMAALFAGNYREALDVATKTANAISAEALKDGTPQRRFVRPWLAHKTFGKWDAILALEPPKEMPPFVEGVWHYVRGSALAKTGKLVEARAALDTVRSIAAQPALRTLRVRVNSAELWLTVASHVLAGEIAAKEGKLDESIGHLDTAVRLEDGFSYMEPPDWGHPIRPILGAVLLAAKRPREAESVYWDDLRKNPETGWSLFGLEQALRAQGKDADAALIHERFEKAWAHADVVLGASAF